MHYKIGFIVSEFLPTKNIILKSLQNLNPQSLTIFSIPIYSPGKKGNNKLLLRIFRETNLDYIFFKIFDTIIVRFFRLIKRSRIENYAKKLNIPFHSLSGNISELNLAIKDNNIDILVLSTNQIMPKSTLDSPKLIAINVHLAKLPESEDAIIIENDKVINTLNSLCREMDKRYELLKDAMSRNIKEYNAKFISRKLNPENGHTFLPYIVLVIDEFADLIMTAGKEVETPLARLAQLSRAVGIHLIIATQRPSVNVITGLIKANFPARIAFRVTSKIDSRTILDTGGAEQLIGRGDLLYSQSNDLTRIQCGFIDTPEVEKLSDFIGSQTGYVSAYILPEFSKEDINSSSEISVDERDSMFNEAARVIVTNQQGSASLLQRKLKLGYNRAGRLIDQMEDAGIVGPFEGSKPRQVLISDLNSLESLLSGK